MSNPSDQLPDAESKPEHLASTPDHQPKHWPEGQQPVGASNSKVNKEASQAGDDLSNDSQPSQDQTSDDQPRLGQGDQGVDEQSRLEEGQTVESKYLIKSTIEAYNEENNPEENVLKPKQPQIQQPILTYTSADQVVLQPEPNKGQRTSAPIANKAVINLDQLSAESVAKLKKIRNQDGQPPTWLRRISWGLIFPALCFTAGYMLFTLLNWQSISGPTYDPNVQGRHQVYSLNIPDNVVFAGEEVPLKDIEVYERFDRELTLNVYWQANTLLLIKRSSRWFPMIQQTLKQQGVPLDFKYVAAIESMFENRFSPAGAAGFWQLMEPAAREYGLEITDEVDERFHAQKATLAACKYFKQAKRNLGSWTSALASYNVGMGGLQRSMTSQKMNNYYDLLVNQETGRYVFRLLSFKQIMENAEDYGFSIDRKHLYQPYRLRYVKVSNSVPDLTLWSISQGINYKILKLYNPWLRKNSLLVAAGKSYTIALPRDPITMAEDDTEALPSQDSLLSDSAVGDRLQDNDPNLIDATPQRPAVVAAKSNTDQPTKPTEADKVSDVVNIPKAAVKASPEVLIHTIVKGESLERICKKYHIRLDDLVALNKLDRSKPLRIGQRIRIK